MATVDPYDLMGVDRRSYIDDVRREARRSFHRLARVVHPDAGGTAEDLRVVAKAYEEMTGETAPPTKLTLRALCAWLIGFDAQPTVAHDAVCMRLFALGDAALEAGFDVNAFVAAELALTCPPMPKDAEERPSKRARMEPLPPAAELVPRGMVCEPCSFEEHVIITQRERGGTFDKYAAMLAERDALLYVPTFDERYAALLEERGSRQLIN